MKSSGGPGKYSLSQKISGWRGKIYRFVKWAVVGLFSAVLDIVLFRWLYEITHSVLVSNLVSQTVVVSIGFTLNNIWAFKASQKIRESLPRFFITLGFNYIFNSALVWMFLKCGFSPTWAKVLSIPIQAPFTFLILDVWVFHKSFHLRQTVLNLVRRISRFPRNESRE
jgi:putative flippase GtrA